MTRALITQMLNVFEGMEQNYGNLWQMNLTPEGLDLLCTAAREYLAAPKQSEPQPLEDLTGVKVCCSEYATCYRPCTPRGRWLANREAQQHTELTDEEINEIGVQCAVVGEAFWSEAHIEFARAVLAAQRSKA